MTVGRLGAAAIGLLGTAAASVLLGGAAQAHSPYLVPTTFAPTRDYVAAQAGLTDETYFVPDFALRGEEFHLIGPSGERSPIESVAALKSFVAVEAPLPADGTYRITTGERSGRSVKMAKIDGSWLAVRQPRPGQAPRQGEDGRPRAIDEAEVPAGAERAEIQGITICETYVTKGAPSDGALATTGKGFELKPLIHPNEIFLDTGFPFEILLDGKPAKGVGLEVFRGGNAYEDKKVFADVTTDENGRAEVSFDRPGVYVVTTRFPGRPAPGEAPPVRSYTYALTFEVTQ